MGPNFAMTTLFVVPTANTLLSGTARSYELNRAVGQFGIFTDAGTTADAAGDVTAANKYITINQARLEDLTTDANKLGTKKSGPIYREKVKNFYKVTASTTNTEQVITISGFDNIRPDETVSLSTRLRSQWIDASYAQSIGLLKTLTYHTPCGTCGDEPCTELTADQIEDMVDYFMTEGNADSKLSQFVTFAKNISITVASDADFSVGEAVTASGGPGTGTVVSKNSNVIVVSTTSTDITTDFAGNLVPAVGSATAISAVSNATVGLTITAKAVAQLKPNSPWMYTNPFELDKVTINAYIYKGAETSQDNIVADRCENIATVATTTTPVYPRGLAAQIKADEIRFHSYQSTNKVVFDDPDYNNFVTYVDAATYTQYFIEFASATPNQWQDDVEMTEWVRIAVPTGNETTIEAILEAFLGSFPELY